MKIFIENFVRCAAAVHFHLLYSAWAIAFFVYFQFWMSQRLYRQWNTFTLSVKECAEQSMCFYDTIFSSFALYFSLCCSVMCALVRYHWLLHVKICCECEKWFEFEVVKLCCCRCGWFLFEFVSLSSTLSLSHDSISFSVLFLYYY